jgi:sugar lactone lactonase YvrE
MESVTSRRGFVRRLGAGTAVLAGPFIHAQDKSDSRKLIVGSGEHSYEVQHDWGELPASIKYGNTHGVVEDSQGRIYVFHTVNKESTSTDAMVVFDEKGKFVKSWGSDYAGGAHGLHIQKEGRDEFLYLCDTKRSIVTKTTLDGQEVMRLGYPKESDFYKLDADGKPLVRYVPTNLAIASNGDIYVGDGYGSSYINQYDKSGKFIRTFGGGKTKDAGSLNSPHGIFIDKRSGKEELVVADRSNNRLQYFTLDGKHSRFVTDEIKLPCHFHFRRNVMLIPDLDARISLFDRNNKLLAHLGDDQAAGDSRKLRTQQRAAFRPGKFVCPHGACFDNNGNIFVAEWVEVGRVTKLRKV